jgi:hypothetical protein
MSTQNINISPQNISGNCDLKCSYNFKYSESNTTAKNNEVMITLTYDNSNIPPVLYNNEKYTVSQIIITSPSIHTFNGASAAAEILIQHTPVAGGPTLIVGIPIISSSESSTASNLITEIIQSVSTNAPSKGDSTNLNISGFTLQNIVPEKPFFTYTANDNTEWIVFGIMYAIPLSSATLTTLSQIIKPFPLPTPGNKLFINKSGPNSSGRMGDGIYISCQPTGSSTEETAVTYSTNTSSTDMSSFWDNSAVKTIIQIIIGCILFIGIFLLFNYIFSYITTGATKIPSLSKTITSIS